MKLHPRYTIVRAASAELNGFVSQLVDKHDLTATELLQLLSEQIGNELKYMLRAERHPDDPDKKANEA